LIIPDWQSFIRDIKEAFEETQNNTKGNYVEYLAKFSNIKKI